VYYFYFYFAEATQTHHTVLLPTQMLRSDDKTHRTDSGGFVLLQDFVELSRLKSWMTQQEDQHRFVVLQCDHWVSPWSRVCIDSADRIVIVCSPRSSPDVGPVEQCLLGSQFKRKVQ
jgi:hypothetical protein